MKADFSLSLAAARAAAGAQHYPAGALYMIATPIGNLADISLRALHVLEIVDALACEDTRHTQHLLSQYGLSKPRIAVHEHNEREASAGIIARLQAGERIAYVSDAGTPGVSDPGARLAAAAQAAGLRVIPLPGASSITALLSCAGLASADGRFVFQGFLSSKAKEREQQILALQTEPRSVVLLEAPHRIQALAQALASLGSRAITLGRELTKQFEQIVTLPAAELQNWLAQDAHRCSGEFAIAIHSIAAPANSTDDLAISDIGKRALELLLEELPLKTAVKLAAQLSSDSRNDLYELALQLKKSSAD